MAMLRSNGRKRQEVDEVRAGPSVDSDAGSIHSLLESLIRAAYVEDDEGRRENAVEGEELDTALAQAMQLETSTDDLLQSLEEHAGEIAPQQDWVREEAEATTSEAREEGPSLHHEALSSHPRDALTLGDGLENDTLERLHTGRSTDDLKDDDHNHLLLKGDDEDVLSRTTSKGSGASRGSIQPKEMTSEDKLQAIIAEFGPSDCDEATGKKERILADEPSALFRRVLFKGYAVLTNHRLCFIAFLPSEGRQGSGLAPHYPARAVLTQGPATLHRPGLTKRKRKAWFVLTSTAITAFPSSDELYEPLGGFRLSDILEVSAYGANYRHSLAFRLRGYTCYLEFETAEAALSWHKDIDVALWRLSHDADKVRISVPLVRISGIRLDEYLETLTLVHVDVLDDGPFASRGQHLHRKTKTDVHTTKDIVFGMNREGSSVLSQIEASLTKPWEWRSRLDKSQWWSLPSPIIEIGEPQDRPESQDNAEEDTRGMQRLLVDEFTLECHPEELQLVKADFMRMIPSAGTLALAPRHLCFYRRRRLTGLADTRIKIPIEDLQKATPAKAFRWHHYGLRLQVRAHDDLLFELYEVQHRDKAVGMIRQAIALASEQGAEKKAQQGRAQKLITPGYALASQADRVIVTLPVAAINQLPRAVNTDSRPLRVAPLKVICLTIGSRGDVQPYIALCKQLQKHNHECIIVSHDEYEDWVTGHGIAFRAAGGDPGALMKLSVENKMFSPNFFRESIGKFRHWLDELLRSIMEMCWDADLIIESPSTFGGIHVAEAVGCYYMRAFTMPWTKTSAYPQAFSVPSVDMGPQYNAMSYTFFDQVLWTASAGQINRWRRHMLDLAPTDQAKLQTSTVPFMYNFSPAVVPPPLDWGSLTAVTGYWLLRGEGRKFKAPTSLIDFLGKAREDGKKLCYIGFGSITIQDPQAVQRAIYEAVQRSNVRAIVSKGWSERMSTGGESEEPVEVPECVYAVDSIPHDWLFPRIDIAMHHGGAGTTGASLGAGLVTLIHPFFGDQYFWSGRVDKLGAGMRVRTLKADAIAEALVRARDDRVIREKAYAVGQAMEQEKGVENAVRFIYTNLSRSRRTRRARKARRKSSDEANSESEETEEGRATRATRTAGAAERDVSPGGSLLTLNGLKHAAYHPMDTLHLSRSRSMRRSGSSTGKQLTEMNGKDKGATVQSPEEVDRQVVPVSVEDSPRRGEEEGRENLRRRSTYLLGLQHLPTFLPHMALPNIMKPGRDADLPEEERQIREREIKEKHRSAKEEDQRRREALLAVWRAQERWDLLGKGDGERVEEHQ